MDDDERKMVSGDGSDSSYEEKDDSVEDNCLASQAGRTRNFSKAYMKMSKQYQRTCLVTKLSLCQSLSNAKSNRSQSPRTRYAYLAHVVGSVSKPAFQELFNISNDTLAKFRAKALSQDIGQDVHANKGNANPQVLNHAITKDWHEQEAETNAEELPVSFQ